MAAELVEIEFLTAVVGLMSAGDEERLRWMHHVEPEMIETPAVRAGYQVVRQLYASGRSIDELPARHAIETAIGDDELWRATLLRAPEAAKRADPSAAREIVRHWRARRQAEVLETAAAETRAALTAGRLTTAREVGDRTIAHLVDLHQPEGGQEKPQTREEFVDAELASIDAPDPDGVRLPWPKLAHELGPLIPGDTIGLTAYSGVGKSTWLANLFASTIQQGTPWIVFPTEMRESWLRRAWAARSGIPQIYAERRQFSRATEAQKEAYRAAVEASRSEPWQVVNAPRITPADLIARARILRRQFSGRPVVVAVDHMHRLDYGAETSDDRVGEATQMLRDWAASDTEGGIILILLYQPRKPSNDADALHRPVMGHQIRGQSAVWNELDILLSPFRPWVKTNPHFRTSWGTQQCEYRDGGAPWYTKPNDEDGKLDDEHVYLKIAKRRTGGEGPSVFLNFDAPSGRIYELSPRDP